MVNHRNNLLGEKRKKIKNRIYITGISVFTTVLISIVLGIKVLSVSVASADEIKKMLIGENVYFNNQHIRLSNENINGIEIINRTTKKEKEDNVNIKIKVSEKSKTINIYSNIKLEYIDKKWVLSENNFSDVADVEVSSDNKDIIINEIKQNGFITIGGNRYSSSTIKEVENLKFSHDGSGDNDLFTAEVTISNGVCYQKNKLSGEVSYAENNKSLNINNIYLDNAGKINKEENIDEEVIKNIIIEEITDNYTYSYSNDGYTTYCKIEKDNIVEFIVKQYIVKEDYTIRAEVEGQAQGNNKDIISFYGFVSISGEPSEGNVKNSRDIIIKSIKKGML